MKTTLNDIQIINLPVVEDTRGNLAFIQEGAVPYAFKRIYYLYDVPSSAQRGGHSHIRQHEILIALSGSFDVVLDDGINKQTYSLNKPSKGLHIVEGIWRELQNFSSGAVCLVIAQDVFDESDYIRGYEDFLESKQ
ncbi:WxcM domain-containing protein [Flavobacterium rivuli WB 3.3-2 = DSM 21788]|uniref:WxcM domain-containing protein n=1 Tax=Flavobacterium rivuli WB 3.3-2 = DSM 21788 TaxID=1121895 RepID=A0A0A2M690_9FLAO|nr:FdtA/QdtA family cupin domain-containing protein [Flavobacterium rivuli]KGO87789.1 WxcM domain-containing protein [Flavobacterium rivuli WB 3.3-2 = DSM 21788]